MIQPSPPVGADLLVSDFHYDLPREAIAQAPTDRREQARLLVLDRHLPELGHGIYSDLPDLVRGDEHLVLNDTRVVLARLRARKATGGRVELLVTGPDPSRPGAMLALARSSKAMAEGAVLTLEDGPEIEVVALGERGLVSVMLPGDPSEVLEAHGEVPLPPYIDRPHGPTPWDRDRYQTVFATHPGSSAAPTAGLHFTLPLLAALEARGCTFSRITLHVGPGTFQPVRGQTLAGHVMHHERYEISEEAAEGIGAARREGRPLLAVGTTVVRTLEAAVRAHGEVVPTSGSTDLFITPGFEFQVVDQLLTNFHLPGSTLLMLVSALAGRERMLAAYEAAIADGYRFFSYGDGMWIR
jgi:S-adenosylmethionine:tRNA ribosyltransferase-isomerase